jgi:hypothetical protein
MESGKTGRYFKYATGEIILVVIGILIALSINNWNSNRIQNNRNQLLLVKLSKELDQNIARCILIDLITDGFRDRRTYSDSILKIMNKGITFQDLDFLTSQSIYYTGTINLSTNIFEQLKNTGSLYAIGSDSLVSAIQDYYQLCERETFYNIEIGKSVLSRSEKCIEGFHSFKYNYKQNPEKAIANHNWIFDPQSRDYAYFQQFIVMTNGHSTMMFYKIKNIIRASEKLKVSIVKEINLQ